MKPAAIPWSSLAAFLVPGLALWLPSGYSYGAALLVLVSLLALPVWVRRPVPRPSRWLLLAIAAMGAVWLLDAGPGQGWIALDRPAKYLAALPALLYLLARPPRPAALFAGLAVGAAGAGLKAVYDVRVAGLERAWGYTETMAQAIQYGNLSALLGLMCWLVLLAQWGRWRPGRLALLGLCGGLGLLGSLLSLSRGGWLALALGLPLWTWLLGRWLSPRRLLAAGAALLATVALLMAFKAPELQRRMALAGEEVSAYQDRGDAQSSVGQRLDHWKLAWRMGLERPWTGWGQAGYEQEKRRRVAAGEAHPFILQFGHAHNELLDQFVKHGLVGVAGLLVFYAVPLALFWPGRARVANADGTVDGERLALHLVGLALPVCYVGFGLTQVFLAHNSGNLFYLFMLAMVHAALQPGGDPPAASAP